MGVGFLRYVWERREVSFAPSPPQPTNQMLDPELLENTLLENTIGARDAAASKKVIAVINGSESSSSIQERKNQKWKRFKTWNPFYL